MTTVVVTRPSPDGERTCEALRAIGVTTVHAPVMTIEIADHPAPPLAKNTAIAFTSANGVRAYMAQSWARPYAAYCIGDATARAAKEAGLPVAAIGSGDVHQLAVMIAANPPDGRVLHIRGAAAAGDLIAELAQRGIGADAAVLYEAKPVATLPDSAYRALCEDRPAIAFFSPRTVAHFEALLERWGDTVDLHRVTAVCLSDAVAGAASALPFGYFLTCEHPNEASFVDTVASLLT